MAMALARDMGDGGNMTRWFGAWSLEPEALSLGRLVLKPEALEALDM
jgi:hypothetical protein